MEWNLGELKRRGKEKFKANYFYCLVAAFLLSVALGGAAGSQATSTVRSAMSAARQGIAGVSNTLDRTTEVLEKKGRLSAEEIKELEDTLKQAGIPEESIRSIENSIENGDLTDEELDELKEGFRTVMNTGGIEMVMAIVAAVIGIAVIISIISFLIDILVLNPLEVGCQYFFLKNAEGDSDLSSIGRGFSPNWGANVGTMLLKGIYLWLWGLLCGIPALIKSYSYRMVPYIIAEHPEMGANEAITLSRRMMDGHKMDAFVLDLSFIGWYLLSIFTCGILLVFYVQPYKACTDAEIYSLLKQKFPELNPHAASYTDPYGSTDPYNSSYGSTDPYNNRYIGNGNDPQN